jgi:hypothetical protein
MTRTRVALTTAAIITAALIAQGIVLGLWQTGFDVLAFRLGVGQLFSVNLFWTLLVQLLHYAAFGLGVYLAIRYIAVIAARDTWRQTITRGIIATISGAIVALAFGAVVSLIAAIAIGPFPFGQSLNSTFDPLQFQYGLENTLSGALAPLIQWLPLTVLGCVFLKLWVAAHPAVESTREPSLRAT